LSSFRGTLGMVAGPALAGVLLARFGVAVAFGVDAGTYLFSLAMLARMRAVPPPPDAEPPSLARVLDGVHYAARRPELLGTYLVDMVAMFFGMPLALFPELSRHFGGATALGLLYAAPSFGAMLASATSGWSGRVRRHGAAVVLAAGCWGLAIVGFGFATRLPLALLLLACAGAADMVSGIFRSTIWNETIPDELRGRLAGIELVSYSSGPLLGNLESGLVRSITTLRTSIVSGGVLCVIGVGVTAACLPRFWRYRATRAEPLPTAP
jgi:MFS family permease